MQLLRKIAFPFSLIYALVVHIRNYLFDIGLFKSRSFKTSTICVGNLSVGGTGKTPMIEYLIEDLMVSHKVAVLSRGYRRKSKGFVFAVPKSKVEELGDEPYQIHLKFPKVAVAVDADRCRGIQKLREFVEPDVILLDDAFQHRSVKPNLSLLLSSYGNLYTRDRYLPTGNLRYGKKEAGRADLIIITKCSEHLSKSDQEEVINSIDPKPNQQVLFCYYHYNDTLKGINTSVHLHDLIGKRVTLVTGIANSKPLVEYLLDKGLNLEHLEYKDHHFFTEKEINLINSKEFVLTTEKDFVRLKNKVKNLYYISVKHVFLGKGASVLEKSLDEIMP